MFEYILSDFIYFLSKTFFLHAIVFINLYHKNNLTQQSMKKFYLLFSTLFSIFTANAQVELTKWDFGTTTGTTTPTNGGNLSLVGTVFDAYRTGVTGLGYSFNQFPSSNTPPSSGTEGISFTRSTLGFSGITASFSITGSNQASSNFRCQYTIDGSTWINATANSETITNAFTTKSYDFSTLNAACNNNPNFAFRIVSVIGTSGNYEGIVGGGYNGNNGYWLLDNVTINYQTLSKKENQINGLKIYPSPANTFINISSDTLAEKQLELYNVLGKKVLISKVTNQAINISNLPKGIYVAKITEDGKTATRKIVIE